MSYDSTFIMSWCKMADIIVRTEGTPARAVKAKRITQLKEKLQKKKVLPEDNALTMPDTSAPEPPYVTGLTVYRAKQVEKQATQQIKAETAWTARKGKQDKADEIKEEIQLITEILAVRKKWQEQRDRNTTKKAHGQFVLSTTKQAGPLPDKNSPRGIPIGILQQASMAGWFAKDG